MSVRRTVAALLLAIAVTLGAGPVSAQAPLQVKNPGWRFVDIVDATQGLSMAEWATQVKPLVRQAVEKLARGI